MIRVFRLTCLLMLTAPWLAFSQSFTQSLTVNGPMVPSLYRPMTGEERWKRWLNEDGASPAIHLHTLMVASATQIGDYPPEWGRTAEGFLRREGNEYGSLIIANSVQEGMAASLGTDTRYFACGCSGVFKRTGHAIEMTFLTYNRNGHKTPDLPQLSGQYGGAMISAMWWPHHYTALVQGVQAGHMEIGLTGVIHIIQEFSPELKHWLHLPGQRAKLGQ